MYFRVVSRCIPVRAELLPERSLGRLSAFPSAFRASYTSLYGLSVAMAIDRHTQSPVEPLNPAAARPPSSITTFIVVASVTEHRPAVPPPAWDRPSLRPDTVLPGRVPWLPLPS